MRLGKEFQPSLAGSLLVAHPGLLDGNFARSVVLVSAHSASGGMGVVINHPLNQTIGEYDEGFKGSALAGVPLYLGGPADEDKIILMAWEWLEGESVFKLYFGISEERAVGFLGSGGNVEVRGFLGYSGWVGGQLEGELKEDAWVLASVKALRREWEVGGMWKGILGVVKPELLFLADSPDDPSIN